MRRAAARLKHPRIEVMLFSVGGARYGITLSQVVGLVRDLPEEIDDSETVLFEGRSVPVFPASDILADGGARAHHSREALIFDDGRGLYGMTVDSTDSVLEVTPGTELYTFPPQEVTDGSPCRPWALLTVGERPVILLDMSTVTLH